MFQFKPLQFPNMYHEEQNQANYENKKENETGEEVRKKIKEKWRLVVSQE